LVLQGSVDAIYFAANTGHHCYKCRPSLLQPMATAAAKSAVVDRLLQTPSATATNFGRCCYGKGPSVLQRRTRWPQLPAAMAEAAGHDSGAATSNGAVLQRGMVLL
jgi:hypothetical protein